jgi:Secretion system C-terminal sorting domain/Pregnancy-associated plasma protein-A
MNKALQTFGPKIFLFPLLLMATALLAQDRPKAFGKPVYGINPANGHVRCVSSEYAEYQQEHNQRETSTEFETWIAQKMAVTRAQRNSNSTNQVITIPVVVHVIHNGDNIGSNENIATAQVLSQITVLNQDFRKLAGTPGDNDEAVGADVEIEFCLAKTDPNGNPTNGIDRVNMGVASWNTLEQIDILLKPQTIWDAEQYFNIWVINFGGTEELTLGYAQFPHTNAIQGMGAQTGTEYTDGVVIGYRYFGSSDIYPQGIYDAPYDKGRTTTHEVGHAFGLRHIWGDGGLQMWGITDCDATDYCDDTPFAAWDNFECPGNIDSCPAKPGLDMTNNYMDYTNDVCMNTFTQDQKLRILTVMDFAPRRASLKTSTVCQSTTATQNFDILNNIYLYPNPAQTLLNITTEAADLPDSYTLYNSLGQVIAHTTVKGSVDLSIDVSGYTSGVYFIKINSGTESKTLRFIKD